MIFFTNKKRSLIKRKKKKIIKPSGEEGCYDVLFNYKDYYYYLDDNSDYIRIFLRLLQENGKKKKIKMIFSKIFHYFYYMVSYGNDLAKDFFSNIYFLKYKFDSSNLYYTINIVIRLAIRDLYSSFKLMCKKKKKKKKKLLKGEKKYYVQAGYVFEEDRRNIALKWIHFYANSLLNKKFEDRLFKSIILTYTEGYESYLFKKKILIYEFYMNSKKQKDKF